MDLTLVLDRRIYYDAVLQELLDSDVRVGDIIVGDEEGYIVIRRDPQQPERLKRAIVDELTPSPALEEKLRQLGRGLKGNRPHLQLE